MMIDNSLIDEEVKALWKTTQLSGANVSVNGEQPDAELAKTVFAQLDTNNSGDLDQSEIAAILLDWEAPPQMVDAFAARIGADGKIDFDAFYRNVWQFGNVRSRLQKATIPSINISEQEKAEFIFNMLDLDQSGAIDYFELQLLLIE